jgi:hypothetical protein
MLQVSGTQMIGFSQGGDRGSNALSKDSSAWFGEVMLECIADWLCEEFNYDAIPQFARRNGYVGAHLPRLLHGKVAVRDIVGYSRAIDLLHRNIDIASPEVQAQLISEMGLQVAGDMGTTSTVAVQDIEGLQQAQLAKQQAEQAAEQAKLQAAQAASQQGQGAPPK